MRSVHTILYSCDNYASNQPMPRHGFSADILATLRKSKVLRIRAGSAGHRFIGIWFVVVNDRVFVLAGLTSGHNLIRGGSFAAGLRTYHDPAASGEPSKMPVFSPRWREFLSGTASKSCTDQLVYK